MDKQYQTVDTSVLGHRASDLENDALVSEKQGTLRDVENMKRLGKDQVFEVRIRSPSPTTYAKSSKRNFGFLGIFGFAMILMNTWQALLGVVAFGLGNGGSAGLIYIFIIVVVFFGIVNISMAEMASMAPTAGRIRKELPQ
jgi:choline transport protein